MNQVDFIFNSQAFWNSVEHHAEEMPRLKIRKSKLLLSVVQQKSRPVEAKLGELKGEIVQLVTYRPIVIVGYDFQVRKFDYRVYGLNWNLLVPDEWKLYSEVQEMIRLNKAYLPNGWPYPVQQFLLEGGVAGHSKLGTPRVLNWLERFYRLLSRAPGDYAMVESEKIKGIIATMTASPQEQPDKETT